MLFIGRSAGAEYAQVAPGEPRLGAESPRVPKKALDEDLLWTHEHARRFLRDTEEQHADMAALVRLALDSGAARGTPGARVARRRREGSDDQAPPIRQREATARGHTEAPIRLAEERQGSDDRRRRHHDRVAPGDAGTAAGRGRRRCRADCVPASHAKGLPAVAAGRDDARLPTPVGGRRRPGGAVPQPTAHVRSWLLGAGMDVVAVSERLGHWSPSLTLSVYAHVIRGRQAELAKVTGSALG